MQSDYRSEIRIKFVARHTFFIYGITDHFAAGVVWHFFGGNSEK